MARLVEFKPQFFSAEGPLADFDPCNGSVRLRIPSEKSKPPLMIVVHSGAGLDRGIETAAAFRTKGFATLVSDAFRMNHLFPGTEFWRLKGGNE